MRSEEEAERVVLTLRAREHVVGIEAENPYIYLLSQIHNNYPLIQAKSPISQFFLLGLQKERLQIDLERMNIESKQMKLDWSVERERLLEEIRKLKSEVKFLIGKLVKAKGKLAVEGELTDTLKKDEPTRSKSVNKTRLSARQASPQRHCVSPLNLSAITRVESPCWNQSMEAL